MHGRPIARWPGETSATPWPCGAARVDRRKRECLTAEPFSLIPRTAWPRSGSVSAFAADTIRLTASRGDFQAAVDAWGNALKLDPNQYIWRRRIQQYGPRLDKPYSFFDWVTEAERAVRARGDEPVRLTVRPTGPEIAYPLKVLPGADKSVVDPDPEGKVHRDHDGLIEAETTVIPGQVRPGKSARVYIVLRPGPKRQTQWNNEGEPLRLWVDPPKDWQVSERLLQSPAPPQAHSTEPRTLTFEIVVPTTAAGNIRLPLYALYNICDNAGGQCRFLRLDIPVKVTIAR
jgi:hypothetical protein